VYLGKLFRNSPIFEESPDGFDVSTQIYQKFLAKGEGSNRGKVKEIVALANTREIFA